MIRPSLPPGRYPFYDKLLFAIFVLVLPPILASTPGLFNDGDSSWHIAAGRWIIEHRQVPKTDPFSFTMVGQPWVAHEWLSEVLLAGMFDLAGHAGVSALVAAALAGLHLVVFLHLRLWVGPAAMLFAFAALDLVLAKFFLARPHLLVWPLLALWTSVLLTSRDRGRVPPLPLALLMLVWSNLHGSFGLGFIIAGAIGFDAAAESQWNKRILLGWWNFGLLALLAALLNGNGADGLLHPIAIMSMDALQYIEEWSPSSPSNSPFFYAVLAGTMLALLAKRRRFRWGEAALMVAMLALALAQIRHQSWLVIVGVMVVAPRLAGAGRAQAPPVFTGAREKCAWASASAAIATIALAARLLVPFEPREGPGTPRSLIAHIPPELKGQPVFNGYSFGGPLILAGVRPYIDGRADMYGDDHIRGYVAMVNHADRRSFDRAIERYGIRWMLLPPNARLVAMLDASPEWMRIYSDRVGVIHVRRSGRGSPVALGENVARWNTLQFATLNLGRSARAVASSRDRQGAD